MEKDRGTKIIAILALLVAMIGLSIGFSAFSNQLTVQPIAKIHVNDEDFEVVFSRSDTMFDPGVINPVASSNGGTSHETTTIHTEGTKVQNLGATFTEPGQSLTYQFYALNTGHYDAYLRSITFAKVSGNTATKVCEAVEVGGELATDSLVQDACNSVKITVSVGEIGDADTITTDGTVSVTGRELLEGNSELITIKIEYLAGGARADGDFNVTFGNILFNYSSAPAAVAP